MKYATRVVCDDARRRRQAQACRWEVVRGQGGDLEENLG